MEAIQWVAQVHLAGLPAKAHGHCCLIASVPGVAFLHKSDIQAPALPGTRLWTRQLLPYF